MREVKRQGAAARVGALGGLAAVALAGMAGCGAPVFGGSGPLARTVFVGDSLSAGYQNGSLLDRQQVHGFANLIAQQAGFSLTLPLIASPGLPSVLELQSLTPLPTLTTAPGTSTGRDDYFARATDLAVPGHLLHDLIYYEPTLTPGSAEDVITDLVLGLPASTSVPYTQLAQAVSFAPTTVFVEAGANDALGADDAGDPSAMTPVAQFAADYATLLGALGTTGAHLVVATVPDVTALPYMTPAAVVGGLVEQYTGVPAQVVEYALGLGPQDLLNPAGLGDVEAEVVGLAAGHALAPLPGGDVLTAAERTEVQATIMAYNQAIAADAAAAHATVVDLYAFLTQIGGGITIDGYTATAGYLNGLFGLDGVHPTNTGYALIANQFITAMNAELGTTAQPVDVGAVAAADPLFPPNLGGASPLAEGRFGAGSALVISPAAEASVHALVRGKQMAAPAGLKQMLEGVAGR